MSLHEYPDLEQGTEAWHAARRGLVTASVVGKLVTAKTLKVASNDESRRLTDLLVAERITELTEPTWVNADMERGVFNEPLARDKYSQHYAPATECGFLVREEASWKLGYSPDGLIGDDGLLEVKSPRAKGHLRTILSGQMPLQHMPQVQAGLLVSGREWLDFVSYHGGMPMFVTRVLPDPAWFKAIVEAVEQFERTAAEMVADYERATKDLVQTERAIEIEMVI